MLALRKAFAGLLLTLTLPVSLVAAWNHGVLSTYFNQNFYHSATFKEEVYPALIRQVTLQIMGAKALEELGNYMSQEDLNEQLHILIPAEAAINMIDDFFDQIKQKPLPQTITIPFEPIQKNIPKVIENIARIVEERTGYPIPAEMLDKEFKSQLENALPNDFKIATQELLQSMPGLPEQQPSKQKLANFIAERGLTVLKWGLWGVWGGLLALMGLLIFSSAALRWWGITLAIDALAILAISQVLKEGLTQTIQAGEALGTEWIPILQPIFKNIATVGFSMLALGIALILSYHWLKPHHASRRA